jgi:hypothetical protein
MDLSAKLDLSLTPVAWKQIAQLIVIARELLFSLAERHQTILGNVHPIAVQPCNLRFRVNCWLLLIPRVRLSEDHGHVTP